ncbi:MAG: hypothetical protein B7Z80_05420 [Rhodospirillales bacterium 20-64-7]|nr:MAG: hypothetical protein B7Z80_05420 [Rhodospirillales bacterium 20-64-7]HQT76447.1 DUF3429 domain-containing protein [Rhodopila sp.]
MADTRTFTVTEPRQVPALSLLLGFGAMIPLAAGAILTWVLPEPGSGLARGAALMWGSAILLFLSGVRRGVSFRTPAGPTVAQILTMLWLFALGLVALPLLPGPLAPVPLLLGYLSIAVLDPIAARRNETSLFFARLRPVQMAIPVISLLAMVVR